jgi:hypothetical protein
MKLGEPDDPVPEFDDEPPPPQADKAAAKNRIKEKRNNIFPFLERINPATPSIALPSWAHTRG